jgi:membrane protease YdiL (CAAX protease family)
MLSAIIAGAILMAVYMRTGSLMAVISIHFAVNLWSFS